MKSDKILKSGVTDRSILAIVYVILVFQPAVIFIYLMTAQTALYVAASWAALLLTTQLCRLSGRPITKQEAALIYLVSSPLVGQGAIFLFTQVGGNPGGWIYQAYFRYSPITATFGIGEYIPDWYSPLIDAWSSRNLLHPGWILIARNFIIWFVCAITMHISLGLICRRLYIEVEDLPFPIVQPVSSAIIALSEPEEEKEGRLTRLHMLGICSVASLLYAIPAYGIPFIARAYGYVFAGIPIPWVDISNIVQLVFPGASLGFATDLAVLALGFVIPLNVTVAMVVGSLALYLVGNHLLVSFGLTGFAKEYGFGMSVSDAWQRSIFNAWASPLVGLAIAAGLMPLLRRPRLLVDAFKALRAPTGQERRRGQLGLPLWIPVAAFLAAALAYTAFDYYLAPDFPVWFFLLINVGWSFLYALITARAAGVAYPFSIPYVREIMIMSVGAPGYTQWFVPIETNPVAESWTQWFKVCDLTDTDPMSFIKATLLVFPFAIGMAFFFVNSFWKLAPIPSVAYPGTVVAWPVQNIFQLLFVTGSKEIFRPLWLAYGFIAMTAIYFILEVVHLGPLAIGLAAGAATVPPIPITMLIGAMFGRLLAWIMGEEWWQRNRGVMAAGLTLGEGITLVIGVVIALAMKAMWVLPY